MERVIYNENPINGKDQKVVKEGSKIVWEKFTYIDFVNGTRKDRKISYLISSFGRVIDVNTKKEVEVVKLNKGRGKIYEKISLYLEMGGYRTYDINELVAEAFVEDDDKIKYGRYTVYPIDGNRNNHRYDNLKWINHIERYIINAIRNDDSNIERLVKILLKHGYEPKDIKLFFKSKPINMKVKLTDIRRLKKELNL